MQSVIRNIGNSKGVILPQSFLKECFIESEVSIEVQDSKIIIAPAHEKKRIGWEEAFKKMAASGDYELIIPNVFEDEDDADWTWK